MAMHGFGIPWNGVGDRIRQIPTYHKYLRVCICNYTDLVFFTTNVTFPLWMGAQRVAHRVFFYHRSRVGLVSGGFHKEVLLRERRKGKGLGRRDWGCGGH